MLFLNDSHFFQMWPRTSPPDPDSGGGDAIAALSGQACGSARQGRERNLLTHRFLDCQGAGGEIVPIFVAAISGVMPPNM